MYWHDFSPLIFPKYYLRVGRSRLDTRYRWYLLYGYHFFFFEPIPTKNNKSNLYIFIWTKCGPGFKLYLHIFVPYPYRPFSFWALDLHNTVPYQFSVVRPRTRAFSLFFGSFFTKMTESVDKSVEDLAVLALLLDEEKENNQRNN